MRMGGYNKPVYPVCAWSCGAYGERLRNITVCQLSESEAKITGGLKRDFSYPRTLRRSLQKTFYRPQICGCKSNSVNAYFRAYITSIALCCSS